MSRLKKNLKNMLFEKQFEKKGGEGGYLSQMRRLGEHESSFQIFDSCVIKGLVFGRDRSADGSYWEIDLTSYKEEKRTLKVIHKRTSFQKQ